MENIRAAHEAAMDEDRPDGIGRKNLIAFSSCPDMRNIPPSDMKLYWAPRSDTEPGKSISSRTNERMNDSSIGSFIPAMILKMSALTSEGRHPERKAKRSRTIYREALPPDLPKTRIRGFLIRIAIIERCIPERASTWDSPERLASSERPKNPSLPVPNTSRAESSPPRKDLKHSFIYPMAFIRKSDMLLRSISLASDA